MSLNLGILRLSIFSQNPKGLLVVTLVLIPLFVIENLEGYVADSIVPFSVSPQGLSLYTVMFVGYLVLQHSVLHFIKHNSKLIRTKSKVIDGIQTAVFLVQYALAINLGLILVQIFVFEQYSTISLFFPTMVTLVTVCVLFFVFGFQFLKWRTNIRQSLGILLFAFSFLVLGAVQFIDLPFLTLSMFQLPPMITPSSEMVPPVGIENEFLVTLIDNSVYLDYAAFSLMIFGTAMLLWQYSRGINKALLAVLIALPLIGYAGSDIEAFHISQLEPFLQGNNYLTFLSLSSLISWLSHSFAFLYVAHRLPNSSIKIFLYMTAIGFILFSLSYTVDVRTGSYPPYSANSFALFPISVYMVLFGIYGSGLSLSQDIQLRKRINLLARGDQDLLSSIGTAHMQNEITRVVGSVMNVIENEEADLQQCSGLDTPMEKEDIENYLQQVIAEFRKNPKK
ncbi:MAG TPA: hypothetical protein VJS91_07070 [Nitrososphaeraceae archaeon]|nr:hypothetical protein [Nitrososphaeraceae archaeon]